MAACSYTWDVGIAADVTAVTGSDGEGRGALQRAAIRSLLNPIGDIDLLV